MKIRLSIQIINYKSKHYLIGCLKSLQKDLENCDFKYNICILENHSGDELSDLENEYPQIKFYYSNKNKGFGQGHNWLAEVTVSDYLLFLNPDVEFIERQTIKRLINTMENNECIGIVGPKLVTKDGIPQPYDHAELSFLGKILFKIFGLEIWTNTIVPKKVLWVSGAVFLIKRNLFKKLGGFDKEFFLYGEEVDLCARTRRFGQFVYYDPTIKVRHFGSVSGGKSKYLPSSIQKYLDRYLPNNYFAKFLNFLIFNFGMKFLERKK